MKKDEIREKARKMILKHLFEKNEPIKWYAPILDSKIETMLLDFASELAEPEVKPVSLKDKIVKLINEGYNIEAVRTYKIEMNCDLREAKYQVSLIRQEIKSEPEVKTAEKIFNRFCTLINKNYTEYIIKDKKGFIKAIYDLASQFPQPIDNNLSKVTNEAIEINAKIYAKDHSNAPDKDCPEWIIADYIAGAYGVRKELTGFINLTNKGLKEHSQEQPMTDEMIEVKLNSMNLNSTEWEICYRAIKWTLSLKAQKTQPGDEDIRRYFDKWIIEAVGIQDADIFYKGTMVRDVAIRYAIAMRDGLIPARDKE